ncbi:GAG-pre-integrase domain-containing protein KNAG_0J01150 [Huiozyma naganishii CBS 8797]|uniref:GAG-pre-integrase domain-containing protein n=1 Tax=Huiozyma naganishii (strain ATCC MYA-139 / BCRC 22969 / CBS 8797 / KCTC 17520 / NBRC 10181 / NCYC 3082 / Yp74L-3) TaxID=1071383 RepID=J7S2R4_HUIN7|nr:hypothetical protein KNAG_0J01150 [Kazachstania naganishii CBS 8797]CCK72197.1 hypothetical protein KNAG_0J01150 [Kazachstania naganishii CBS 8797]
MKGGGAVHGIGASLKIQGNGIVKLGKYTVNDTAYVPNLPCNLLSVSKMTQKTGKCVIFTESQAYIASVPAAVLNKAKAIGELDVKSGLYSFKEEAKRSYWAATADAHEMNAESTSIILTTARASQGELWHARLGHPGKLIYRKLEHDIKLPKYELPSYAQCSTCSLLKGVIKKGPSSDRVVTAPLQLIQADICASFR